MTTSPTSHSVPFTNALQKSIQYTNYMPINPNVISAPASPEPYSSDLGFNSDDLVPTSALEVNDDEIQLQQHQKERTSSLEPYPLTIVGNYYQRFTLGRGGSCTIKIGRRNRQISRTHVAIEYAHGRFELVILGLNGASVDHLPYRQHERAPLDDHSFVDVLGDTFIFRLPAGPPPHQKQPLCTDTKLESTPTTNNAHLSSSPSSPVHHHDEEQGIIAKPTVDLPSSSQHKDEIKQDNQAESDDDNSDEKNPAQQDTTPETIEKESPVKKQALSESTENAKPTMMNTSIKSDISYDKEEVAKENIGDDDNKENNHTPSNQEEDSDATDYAENIIDILVFSRKSSMPISDICSRIIKANPSYKKQDRDIWTQRIQRVLKEKPFFGEIVRKGKTADGSPKEHLYYYNSDMDPVEWRRATYTQVGRSARKCTLQDKQYFWRIPPKLGKNRNAYIPPPAPTSLPLQEKRKLDQPMGDGTVKKQKL